MTPAERVALVAEARELARRGGREEPSYPHQDAAVRCLRALADALEESERIETEARPDLVEIARRLRTAWPWCVECDARTKTDEDGCCVTCGADAILPSEADVQGQDHAPEDLAALVARVETLERFVAAWDACDGNRGLYSCTPLHDCRCSKDRGIGDCTCGADELRAARAALEE